MKRKIGVLIRTYAGEEGAVFDRVHRVIHAFEKLQEVQVDPAFKDQFYVRVVIPTNGQFKEVDCGKMCDAVQGGFAEVSMGTSFHHHVVESKGDMYCGIPNESLAEFLEAGCSHMLVISTRYADHITVENINMLMQSFQEGALVAGLAIEELLESIKQGLVANTFAVWSIKELIAVGGFDMKACDEAVGEVKAAKGTEEVIPSIRLGRKHGKCIKVVTPHVSQQSAEPADGVKHKRKMDTKSSRQEFLAQSIGSNVAEISQYVM